MLVNRVHGALLGGEGGARRRGKLTNKIFVCRNDMLAVSLPTLQLIIQMRIETSRTRSVANVIGSEKRQSLVAGNIESR